jgi:hypothetical protein
LAIRPAVFAGAPKNDVVGRDRVPAPVPHALDRRFQRRILERLDLAAVVADEVMVVVAAGKRRLEAGAAVSEVDTLNEPEPVEPFERSIDACDSHAWSRRA